MRSKEFDIVKGMIVILVILTHFATHIISPFVGTFATFIMAIFIFLSGYFIKDGSVIQQYKARNKKLVIPFLRDYVIMAAISIAILFAYREITVSEAIRSFFSEFFKEDLMNLVAPGSYIKTELCAPMTVTYFFVQLILATAIALPIKKACGNSKIKLCANIILFLCISTVCYGYGWRLPLMLQMTFAYIAFLLLAFYFHEIKFFDAINRMSAAKRAVLTIILWGLSYLIARDDPKMSFAAHGILGSRGAWDPILSLIQLIIGLFVFYNIASMLVRNSFLSRTISFLGEHSYDYVMYHYIIGWIILKLLSIPVPVKYYPTGGKYTFSQWCIIAVVIAIQFAGCTLIAIWKKRYASHSLRI